MGYTLMRRPRRRQKKKKQGWAFPERKDTFKTKTPKGRKRVYGNRKIELFGKNSLGLWMANRWKGERDMLCHGGKGVWRQKNRKS